MSDDGDEDAAVWTAMALFAAIFALIGVDLAGDWVAGISVGHAIVELTVLAAAAVGIVRLWTGSRRLRREAGRLGAHVAEARAEAERWRAEVRDVVRGLGAAMSEQFRRWGLTAAEEEVALLLVKGLSHKEVAQVRGTSERTVRQQALAIYRKAGVGGRAELSAFFLEDLLLPLQRPGGEA